MRRCLLPTPEWLPAPLLGSAERGTPGEAPLAPWGCPTSLCHNSEAAPPLVPFGWWVLVSWTPCAQLAEGFPRMGDGTALVCLSPRARILWEENKNGQHPVPLLVASCNQIGTSVDVWASPVGDLCSCRLERSRVCAVHCFLVPWRGSSAECCRTQGFGGQCSYLEQLYQHQSRCIFLCLSAFSTCSESEWHFSPGPC